MVNECLVRLCSDDFVVWFLVIGYKIVSRMSLEVKCFDYDVLLYDE